MEADRGFYESVLQQVVGEGRAKVATRGEVEEGRVLDAIEEWFATGGGDEEERKEFMSKANLVSPEQNGAEAVKTARENLDTISRRLFSTHEVTGSPMDEFEFSP